MLKAKEKVVAMIVRQYLPLIIGSLAGTAGTWLAVNYTTVHTAFCTGGVG